ncbi:MAG: hypothetical protein AB7S48_04995 [Bacteroidales bacterium]
MKLYDALNIRKDESLPVMLFVFQSFFLGTFLGTFDVGANTLFLQVFDDTMIAKAIVISGLTGIFLTSLYSYFQGRLVFSRLAVINLFVVFVFTFLLRFGYYFSDTKWLAFALFVFMGPLNIIALVGFWGAVSRIFDLRQGKRLFGIIDMGQVIGIIISSWAVPFLVAKGFESINLIYISAFSALFAFALQILINSHFSSQLKTRVAESRQKSRFVDTMRIPYVRTMAFFVICSMLVAFFVHYLFLAVADARFASNEELAKFLGALMGTLTFVSILIKTFVYGPLMKNYGLRVSLLISPIIVSLVSVGAALVGSFFGYTIASGAFTFFFLLISLAKLFQKALKDSIEAPSLKMIYQSLDPSIRYEVQARVDGTINEMSALASGVFLTILGLFSFIHLIHYTYFLIGIIVLWTIVTFKLYRGYRRSLEETLEKSAQKESEISASQKYIASLSGLGLTDQIRIIERSKPWEIVSFIKEKLSTSGLKEVVILLDKAKQLGAVELIPTIEKFRKIDSDILNDIDSTIDYLKSIQTDSSDNNKISAYINSKNYEDRVYAAKLIGAAKKAEVKNNLTFLMRDLVPAVKMQAIWAARGTRSKELIIFLIDFLDKDQYAPIAHAALMNSGENGLEMLELALQRTNTSSNFRERILRIIPSTGSQIASTVLYSNLSVKSSLCHIAVDGLIKLNFTADEKERLHINKMLIEQTGICAWNLNAYHHCPHGSIYPYLRDELEQEYRRSIHTLFSLLKLIYDKNSIEAVLENLEAGTGQSISYAVELLDTFLDEEMKPYIVPLLEDTSISNKLWALENYFPLRHVAPEELLKTIINRDNNLISKQAKIFALNAFQYIENRAISNDLIAQLFNTDKYLRQISAQIIESINRDEFLSCKKRLNDKLRVELDRLMDVSRLTNKTVIDRINFYKTVHSTSVEWECLLFILYNASVVRLGVTDYTDIEIFTGKTLLLYVEQGMIEAYGRNAEVQRYVTGSIVNTSKFDSNYWRLKITEESIIHYIELDKVVNSMYDNEYLIQYIENI